MKTYKKAAVLTVLAAVMLISACTVVGESRIPLVNAHKAEERSPVNSETKGQASEKPQAKPKTEETFETELETAPDTDSETPLSTEFEAQPDQTEPIPEEYQFTYINYDPDYKDRLDGYFTDEQLDYIRSCVFVGDSTCLAFQYYGFISPERCYAKAGAAARNIFDWEFTQRKEEKDILTALADSGCKSFYFLMGLNDVNLTSAEDYYNNYKSFLEAVQTTCPYADINLLSITPVTKECEFCFNSSLNRLNDKLIEISRESGNKIKYIDIASFFRNEEGNMKSAYVTNDGIHLREGGYYDILRIICQEAGV